MDETKIKTIERTGLAVTRYAGKWIIDHNAVVISDIPIPADSMNKVISTPFFKWVEQVKEKHNPIAKTEEAFKSYCISNNIKYKSKAYYKFQHTYFNGAIAAIGEIPPKWSVCILSDREIIEDYTKK